MPVRQNACPKALITIPLEGKLISNDDEPLAEPNQGNEAFVSASLALMSALSTKAASITPVILDVVLMSELNHGHGG